MPGLLRGVARTAVVAGTATAVSNRVSRRQYGHWAEQEPAAPADDGMNDRIAQLKEMAALHEQGVLSDAEFETQKRRLLGS